jgi:hypothetical protein
MAEAAEPPRVLPILRMRILTCINATTSPLDVAMLAAGCLAQASNRPIPAADSSLEDCVRSIAEVVPLPFGLQSELPESVKQVLALAAATFSPTPTPPSTAPVAAPLTTAHVALVESPADREQRERYIVVHGTKYVRKSEPPYSLFYVHHWVTETYSNWAAEWAALTRNLLVPDIHRLKHDALLRSMKGWFAWRASSTPSRLDDLSEPQTSMFAAIVEMLAELFLLCVPAGGGKRVASTTAIATATFHSITSKRRHDQSISVNYYAELAEAQAATTAPKNYFFRSHNGDRGEKHF